MYTSPTFRAPVVGTQATYLRAPCAQCCLVYRPVDGTAGDAIQAVQKCVALCVQRLLRRSGSSECSPGGS